MRVLFDLEALVTKMRGELWEALRDNHDMRMQRIYRLDITVDRQTADETIRSERFTRPNKSGEIRRAPPVVHS